MPKYPVVSNIFQYRNLIFFSLPIEVLLSDWSVPYQNLMQNQGQRSCFFRTQISKGLKIIEVQGGKKKEKNETLPRGGSLSKQSLTSTMQVGVFLSLPTCVGGKET